MNTTEILKISRKNYHTVMCNTRDHNELHSCNISFPTSSVNIGFGRCSRTREMKHTIKTVETINTPLPLDHSMQMSKPALHSLLPQAELIMLKCWHFE